jgi:hypothetical protein
MTHIEWINNTLCHVVLGHSVCFLRQLLSKTFTFYLGKRGLVGTWEFSFPAAHRDLHSVSWMLDGSHTMTHYERVMGHCYTRPRSSCILTYCTDYHTYFLVVGTSTTTTTSCTVQHSSPAVEALWIWIKSIQDASCLLYNCCREAAHPRPTG